MDCSDPPPPPPPGALPSRASAPPRCAKRAPLPSARASRRKPGSTDDRGCLGVVRQARGRRPGTRRVGPLRSPADGAWRRLTAARRRGDRWIQALPPAVAKRAQLADVGRQRAGHAGFGPRQALAVELELGDLVAVALDAERARVRP